MKHVFAAVAVFLVVAVLFGVMGLGLIDDYTATEIERYSIEMEITHAEKTAYYVRNHGESTTLTFYLRGNDKAIAINVSPETYARFKQGDWVEVEIRVTENAIFHDVKETARIIGAMEH